MKKRWNLGLTYTPAFIDVALVCHRRDLDSRLVVAATGLYCQVQVSGDGRRFGGG